MVRSGTAQTALDAVWARMVELAEAGHDLVVLTQASADAAKAKHIALMASDVATLAKAAEVLAREANNGA